MLGQFRLEIGDFAGEIDDDADAARVVAANAAVTAPGAGELLGAKHSRILQGARIEVALSPGAFEFRPDL
jgi:hypothetical protein